MLKYSNFAEAFNWIPLVFCALFFHFYFNRSLASLVGSHQRHGQIHCPTAVHAVKTKCHLHNARLDKTEWKIREKTPEHKLHVWAHLYVKWEWGLGLGARGYLRSWGRDLHLATQLCKAHSPGKRDHQQSDSATDCRSWRAENLKTWPWQIGSVEHDGKIC